MKNVNFITCKKNFYDDYSGKTYLLRNLFKKPTFKKDKKYEVTIIDDIMFTAPTTAITYSVSGLTTGATIYTNGTSGTSGSSGTNGTSATCGSSGTNGTSGTSGSSVTNGTSATCGSSGTNGISNSFQFHHLEKLYIFINPYYKMYKPLIDEYFYSTKEERKLKLKKINKLKI